MYTKITRTDRFIAATILKVLPKEVRPNHITLVRLISVPFVVWLFLTEKYITGIFTFSFFAFTDAIDGALARTKNQITDFGKHFDPATDKLFIGSVALVVVYRFLSPSLAFAIISIEILLMVSALVQKRFAHKIVQANGVGKAKMFMQSIGIGLIVLSLIFVWPPFLLAAKYTLYVAVFFGLLSLFVYKGI